MLEVMLSGEKWSLRPWKKTIDDQLNSWIMYVPGMKDSHETKELSAFKGTISTMYCTFLSRVHVYRKITFVALME